jgi:hypothetical protein
LNGVTVASVKSTAVSVVVGKGMSKDGRSGEKAGLTPRLASGHSLILRKKEALLLPGRNNRYVWCHLHFFSKPGGTSGAKQGLNLISQTRYGQLTLTQNENQKRHFIVSVGLNN